MLLVHNHQVHCYVDAKASLIPVDFLLQVRKEAVEREVVVTMGEALILSI